MPMNIAPRLRALAVAAVMVMPPFMSAQADTWFFPAEVTTKEYTFGDVRVVMTTDATRNQGYPNFLFTVSKAGTEIARYPGMAFETVVASPDNRYFVGLSNSGLPGSAVIVFDASGKVLLLAGHNMAVFDYCHVSVTLARVWYDREKPEVEFKLDGEGAEQGIYLHSCHGKRIELLRTVAEAYARTIETLK